jgi:hypothetical protein
LESFLEEKILQVVSIELEFELHNFKTKEFVIVIDDDIQRNCVESIGTTFWKIIEIDVKRTFQRRKDRIDEFSLVFTT